jgi:hypothetical protein
VLASIVYVAASLCMLVILSHCLPEMFVVSCPVIVAHNEVGI